MAIYEINGARYEIDDTNLTKQQLDAAIEEIAAQPRDSALDYSFDVAAQMGYKGTEAVGSALQGLGLDTVGSALQGFGARGVAQQEEDIARGNYQAQYTGSLLEQDDIGDAAGWLLEGMQANAASGGFALAGTAAAAVAGLVSAPAAMLLGGATLAGSFLMGTGESALEQEEKTGSYDSSVALGTGALIGFLDRFGAGRVFSPSQLGKMSVKELYEKLAQKGYTEAAQEVAKEIGKKAVTEGVTEATQEAAIMGSAASQGGQYTAGEVGNRLVDAAALGTGFGGTAATGQAAVQGAAQAAGFAKSSTQRQADTLSNAAATMLERGMDTGDQAMIDKANEAGFAIESAKNGDLAPLKKLAVEEQENNDPSELAKASFAQRLQGIIDDESASDQPFDVENIDVNDAQSARGIVDAAHFSIKEGINNLKAILKEGGTLGDGTSYAGLNPQNAKTFDELMQRVEAMVGVNMAKNKVKKTITEKQVAKVKELVGDTQEGQQLVNLIRESVVLTDLHNTGYQGGLSKITDKLNPFAPTGSYNTSALVQAAVRAGVTGAAAAGTGGMSLAIQLPIVGFGRLYDALGGDRSTVSSFIRDNKAGDVLPEPTPPSIVADQAAAQQRQEQVSAAMQPIMAQQDQVSGGPVAQIMDIAQGRLNIPVTKQDYDAALDSLIERITDPQAKQIFQDIKDRKYGDQMPQEAMAILSQEIMANKAGEAQQAQEQQRASQQAMIDMAQRMAIEQGKADNRAAVQDLLDQLNADNVINKGHKAQLQSALAGTFLRDLGRNPMATVENTIKDLQDNGVPQEAIDTYIMPYVQRVARQQDSRPQEFTEESTVLEREPVEAAPRRAHREIGELLTQQQLDKYGKPLEPMGDEADFTTLVDAMTEEAEYQLAQTPDAVTWYADDIDTAMNTTNEYMPGLFDSADNRQIMFVLAALTSVGHTPTINWRYASDLMRHYIDTGEIGIIDTAEQFQKKDRFGKPRMVNPQTRSLFGLKSGSVEPGLKIFRHMLETRGVKDTLDFLYSNQKKSDIDAIRKEAGFGPQGKIKGGKNAEVPGIFMFGPKVGPFFLNLNGINEVTVDVWATRTYRRYTGDLLKKDASDGNGLNEQPNEVERPTMKEAFTEVGNRLNITPQAAQALLWYYEQGLYRDYGATVKSESFSNAAETYKQRLGAEQGSGGTAESISGTAGGILSEQSAQPELPRSLSEPVSSAQPAQPVQEEVVVPTVRQVAAQEENATPIFEVGKPGSPFENGIKKRADLERLAKALGIVFGTVKSMAAMERETGIKNKSGVTTMGGASISRYGRKPPSMILMEPGYPRRYSNEAAPVQSKDGFIATLAHEIAHFLEALPVVNPRDNTSKGVLSAYDPELTRSPLTLNEAYVQPTSFRSILLETVRYAERKEDVTNPALDLLGITQKDAKLILEEITNLQDFGNINLDTGDGTVIPHFVRAPFGADPNAFADGSVAEFEAFKKEQIEEEGASPAQFISSEQYRIQAVQTMTKHRNNYIRNPAEFAVDPIWVYMVDPKFAKESMPTTAEFIRKLLNNATFNKDTLQFYSSPIATMVAAALAVLAANGGEEPEEQPIPPGALSPQGQGALSII
jgi:hypothetical protein